MKKVKLLEIAFARSGDKGKDSNIGLIAETPEVYEHLVREVTSERVKKHFCELVRGEIKRYEIPNLLALNFILGDSLGGGGTTSLLNDAQGKTYGQKLLTMEIEVPDDFVVKPLNAPEA